MVGNHEFYDGAELGRFLNQTWEGWGPIAGGDVPTSSDSSGGSSSGGGGGGDMSSSSGSKDTTAAKQPRRHGSRLEGRSTATSALGAFLATGNFHAVAHHDSDDDGHVEGSDSSTSVSSGEDAREAARPRVTRPPHPSNTSRYYSFDYGLVHFIALDLNVRWCDLCVCRVWA